MVKSTTVGRSACAMAPPISGPRMKPTEEAVNSIAGVKRITSRSLEGLGQMSIEFSLDADMGRGMQEVRDRIAAVQSGYPREVRAPTIARWNNDNSQPVVNLALLSKTRNVFWVAIGSPRHALMDALAHAPSVRSLVAKLPKSVQPKPTRHAFVAAYDLEGNVVESLQYLNPESYSPIASAIEHDGFLYLGSFAREGVARVKLDPIPAAPAKPE